MGGTIREAAATALAGARTIVLIGLVLAAAWAISGSAILYLFFGVAFQPVYAPLLVLLPGIVLLSMQRVCGPTVLRTGRPWMMVGLLTAGFASNLLLNLWWIPKWGLVGAAAASTVSYALSALGFLTWTARLGGGSLVAAIPAIADGRRVVSAVRAYRQSGSSGNREL
jgi:O-antigen/teichoic acid export membrane protein